MKKRIILTCCRGGGKSIDLLKLASQGDVLILDTWTQRLSRQIEEEVLRLSEFNKDFSAFSFDEPKYAKPNDHINYLASLGGKKKKNKKVRSWDK